MLRFKVTGKRWHSEKQLETTKARVRDNSTDNFIEIDVCVRKYFLQQINCKKSEIAWYGTPVNITVNKSTL